MFIESVFSSFCMLYRVLGIDLWFSWLLKNVPEMTIGVSSSTVNIELSKREGK